MTNRKMELSIKYGYPCLEIKKKSRSTRRSRPAATALYVSFVSQRIHNSVWVDGQMN